MTPYKDWVEIEEDAACALRRKRLNQAAERARFKRMSWPARIFWACYLAAILGVFYWTFWGRV